MKLSKKMSAGLLVYLLPIVTLAQNGDNPELGNIDQLIQSLQDIVNALIPLASAIALLAFFFGLAKFIFQADDEEAKDNGKRIMIGGIIALFLIAAVGGLVEFIASALDVDTGQNINPTGIDTNPNI